MQSTRLAILHLAVIHLRDSNLIKKVTLISTTFSGDLENKRNLDTFLSYIAVFSSQIFEHLTHDPASPECLDILQEYLVGKGGMLCLIEYQN